MHKWISGVKTVISAWKKMAGSCDGSKSKMWGDVLSFAVVKTGVNVRGWRELGPWGTERETSETQCVAKPDRASSRATKECCVSWESRYSYSMWMGSPGKRWALLKAPLGFPGGSDGKESACNAGDLGSISGLRRSSGEGKGYSLQYSGLENSIDCIVHGGPKELDMTERLSLYFIR